MSLTDEQIQEALKSDAATAAIKAAVDEEVKGLKNKNSELLGSIKDLKTKLSEIEAEKEEAETAAATKSGDVEKIRQQLEVKHKKELEARDGQIAKLTGQLETHVIGEGLTQALTKAKVQPALMDAAKALIRSNFKGEVGDNDGQPFAKFDGKAVDEFVTGWAQSEGGKHFVSAENNSGGGSNGANGRGQAGTDKKTMTRTEFDNMSVYDRSKAAREGVVLTD